MRRATDVSDRLTRRAPARAIEYRELLAEGVTWPAAHRSRTPTMKARSSAGRGTRATERGQEGSRNRHHEGVCMYCCRCRHAIYHEEVCPYEISLSRCCSLKSPLLHQSLSQSIRTCVNCQPGTDTKGAARHKQFMARALRLLPAQPTICDDILPSRSLGAPEDYGPPAEHRYSRITRYA